MGCARLPSARGSDVEDVEGPTSLLCKRTRWSPCTAPSIWVCGDGSSADACATDDAEGAPLTGSSLLSQMKPWRPKAFTSSGSWQISQHVDVAKFWWWKVSNPWMLRHRWQWMRRTGSPTDSASRQQPANCSNVDHNMPTERTHVCWMAGTTVHPAARGQPQVAHHWWWSLQHCCLRWQSQRAPTWLSHSGTNTNNHNNQQQIR